MGGLVRHDRYALIWCCDVVTCKIYCVVGICSGTLLRILKVEIVFLIRMKYSNRLSSLISIYATVYYKIF